MNEKKISIALCDDDKNTHDEIRELLNIYSRLKEKHLILSEYYSAKELLESRDDFEILLLDFDMPDCNGISAAKKLRNKGNISKIIMLTGYPECYKEAFKVQAVRFVTKKIVRKELFEALDCTIESMIGNELIELNQYNKKVIKTQYEITCIIANDDFLKVYIGEEVFFSSLTLKEMEEVLDQRLFNRCHKSVIINFSKIVNIKGNLVFLDNGFQVSIAKRRRKEFLNSFIKFDTKIR